MNKFQNKFIDNRAQVDDVLKQLNDIDARINEPIQEYIKRKNPNFNNSHGVGPNNNNLNNNSNNKELKEIINELKSKKDYLNESVSFTLGSLRKSNDINDKEMKDMNKILVELITTINMLEDDGEDNPIFFSIVTVGMLGIQADVDALKKFFEIQKKNLSSSGGRRKRTHRKRTQRRRTHRKRTHRK
jgi:hypothetical protein